MQIYCCPAVDLAHSIFTKDLIGMLYGMYIHKNSYIKYCIFNYLRVIIFLYIGYKWLIVRIK